MCFKSNVTTPAVAVISFCLIGGTSTTPAYADLGDQLFKLLPDDGAADDQFGISVAISPDGIGAIVGAVFDYDNGPESGSAYLFDTTTGRQIAKLLADDGAEYDYFGISVAISGGTVIVGAVWDDDNGSAYLFDISNPANPTQLFKLLADDGAAFDSFGHSVAISGATAIVGARWDDDNGGDSGSAYLFDTTTGRQIAKLLPDDGAAVDWFGLPVAISGAVAIVGAHQDVGNSGSAYLFDTTTGRQLFKLLPDDGAAVDSFGYSVAISGAPGKGVAIVGAYLDEQDNGTNSGAAYLFDTTTGRQIAKLLANDGAEYDYFGFSVAIGGAPGKETAIVGAPYDDDNGFESGSAYLFDAAAPGMCPWDLDGNGSVGASDLLDLLFNWGPCPGCAADFDGDDIVGASDLLAMLFNWGPCP